MYKATIVTAPHDVVNCLITVQQGSSESDGITDLRVVGKFGGFTIVLESSNQKQDLLLASLKGIVLTITS